MKMKSFHENNQTQIESILIATLIGILGIQFYFFVIIPQFWTLRDDYKFALLWGPKYRESLQFAWEYFLGILPEGRLQPVDAFFRGLFYRFIPIEPRSFHFFCFLREIAILGSFAFFLRAMKRSWKQIILALVLVSSNLAMKEWILTFTASETWATLFLFLSLGLYASENRKLALLLFPISFLSKEPFVIFVPLFFFLEWQKGSKLKTQMLKVLPFASEAAVACLVIFALPRRYSSNLSVSKIELTSFLLTLIAPALKSFGPTILLFLPSRLSFQRRDFALLIFGAYIIVAYTLLLNAWGPFSSWFYLHGIIPFGWAILLTVLLEQSYIAQTRMRVPLIYLVSLFATLSSVNGARNATNFTENARKMAVLSCREATQTKVSVVYNNCYEGASQIENSLLLDPALEEGCLEKPHFEKLDLKRQLPEDGTRPWLFLYSPHCDVFDLASLPSNATKFTLSGWTLYRYVPQELKR